jgi:hypothetical protein
LSAAKALDAVFTRQLEEKLAPIINDLRKQANDTPSWRAHCRIIDVSARATTIIRVAQNK